MKKCVIKSIFSNYGIFQVILLTLVFAVSVFLSFDPTNYLNSIDYLEEAIKGFSVVVLLVLPVLGFTGLKEDKYNVFDFIKYEVLFYEKNHNFQAKVYRL